MFECDKVDQLALNLEYNSRIAVGEFISHYAINSNVYPNMVVIPSSPFWILCLQQLFALILCAKTLLHLSMKSSW